MWTASCQTVVPRHTGKGRYSTLPLILTWTLSPEVGRGNNPQSQFGKMTFTVAFAPVVLFLHLTLITGLRRPPCARDGATVSFTFEGNQHRIAGGRRQLTTIPIGRGESLSYPLSSRLILTNSLTC